MVQRGALIILEGCDKVGKSTQCQLLLDWLRSSGEKADIVRFPDRSTAIGTVISRYLKGEMELDDHSVHLLFSANRWELVPKMLASLHSGTHLIVDRYAYSGVAFTAAKPGFTMHWCRQPDVGLPQPDVVLYLTLSSEELNDRPSFGDERYEKPAFQERVRSNFESLRDTTWQSIDAGHSIDSVHSNIKTAVKEALTSAQSKPIGALWTKESMMHNVQ